MTHDSGTGSGMTMTRAGCVTTRTSRLVLKLISQRSDERFPDSDREQLCATTNFINRSPMHGHKALLIDMGFTNLKDASTVQRKELTWAHVYERLGAYAGNSQISLLFVTGAPEKWTLADSFEHSMTDDLRRWKFTTVQTPDCNLHCAWDPSSWSSPIIRGANRQVGGHPCDSVHLGDERYAMSIRLKYKSEATPLTDTETFQLILTKLFSGTTDPNWKMTDSVLKECWRTLLKTTTSSQRWIIAGDLATRNTVTMSNRLAYLDGDVAKEVKIDMITHESGGLAAMSCEMDLTIAEGMDDPQSMVMQFHIAGRHATTCSR